MGSYYITSSIADIFFLWQVLICFPTLSRMFWLVFFCPLSHFKMSYSLFSIRVLILLLKRTLYSIILPDQFRPFCMRIFSFSYHTKCLFLFHFPLYVICGAFNYIPRVYFERCWFAFKQTKKSGHLTISISFLMWEFAYLLDTYLLYQTS